MSQNDLVIANQSFPATRADINSALQALGSLNSGSSAPATTYANMLWYDTTNNTLKMRAEANDVWISIGYLDQTAEAFRIFDDTQVVNSSGTQTGIIGDQATSAWQAGTSTTESLVSPAKVKAAIDTLITVTGSAPVFGVRAWCRWDATGANGVKAPDGEGNIGTLTKVSTGQWTVTFDAAMPDENYAISFSGGNGSDFSPFNQYTLDYFNTTSSGFSFSITDATSNAYTDPSRASFLVVR